MGQFSMGFFQLFRNIDLLRTDFYTFPAFDTIIGTLFRRKSKLNRIEWDCLAVLIDRSIENTRSWVTAISCFD